MSIQICTCPDMRSRTSLAVARGVAAELVAPYALVSSAVPVWCYARTSMRVCRTQVREVWYDSRRRSIAD